MQVQTVQKTVAHLYVYAMCAPVGNVCTRRKSDVWFNATLRCRIFLCARRKSSGLFKSAKLIFIWQFAY